MKKQNIDSTLLSLYEKGYNNFLCAVTAEKGLTPIRAILQFRESCPDIMVAAMICPSIKYAESSKYLFDTTDSIGITSDAYFDEAFRTTNEFLISRGGVVLCHDNQQDGCTVYAFTEEDFKDVAILVQFDDLNLNSPFNR